MYWDSFKKYFLAQIKLLSEDKKDENIISSNENEKNTEKVDNQPEVDKNLNDIPNDVVSENQNTQENQRIE